MTERTRTRSTPAFQQGPQRFPQEMLSLLYSCGDVQSPRLDTAAVLESITLSYIASVIHSAAAVSTKGKVTPEEIKWVFRGDDRKRNRVEELERMSRQIKRAREVFDDVDG
eukprot:TRINITY_DN84773_c0_g1_i1.p1 TRINITY_DN84773_c0_g1~~TRINITY_DN84773_c0_g1_i1.p1  ORF type:complete len:111 (+),score=16.72 TRINITY_DN84773_c0_g1_i1:1-333(+)